MLFDLMKNFNNNSLNGILGKRKYYITPPPKTAGILEDT